MSRVSYFQRFSQKENHVTNNTLLILRHIYRAAPHKIGSLLNALLEEDVSVGLAFQQQLRGSHSVPDALIAQKPLSLFVEAKRGDDLDADQLARHVESIKGLGLPKGSAILIGLARQHPDAGKVDEWQRMAEAAGVRFFTVTYLDLATEMRKLFAEHEQELLEIVDDYTDFLTVEGLLSNPNGSMVMVPCGISWRQNVQFGLYHEPANRAPKKNCRFLGLYHDKMVSHVGRVVAVAVCRVENGALVVEENEFGTLTAEHRSRIQSVIASAIFSDLELSHRYYMVDGFASTSFRKASPNGLWGHRYVDLADLVDGLGLRPDTSAEAVAVALSDKTFE